jgi:hypothetical protein
MGYQLRCVELPDSHPPPAAQEQAKPKGASSSDELTVGWMRCIRKFCIITLRGLLLLLTCHLVSISIGSHFIVQLYVTLLSLAATGAVQPVMWLGAFLLLLATCKASMQALAAVIISFNSAWGLPAAQAREFHLRTAGWLRGELRLWECLPPLLLFLAPFYALQSECVPIFTCFVAAPTFLLLPLIAAIRQAHMTPLVIKGPSTVLGYPEVRGHATDSLSELPHLVASGLVEWPSSTQDSFWAM